VTPRLKMWGSADPSDPPAPPPMSICPIRNVSAAAWKSTSPTLPAGCHRSSSNSTCRQRNCVGAPHAGVATGCKPTVSLSALPPSRLSRDCERRRTVYLDDAMYTRDQYPSPRVNQHHERHEAANPLLGVPYCQSSRKCLQCSPRA